MEVRAPDGESIRLDDRSWLVHSDRASTEKPHQIICNSGAISRGSGLVLGDGRSDSCSEGIARRIVEGLERVVQSLALSLNVLDAEPAASAH